MPENEIKAAVKEALAESKEKKPGFKTTEFWLASAASIVGMLMASGVFETEGSWGKILGLAAAALASMGYSAARARTKAAGK